MKIETSEQCDAAIARLKELGGHPVDILEQDEFFEIRAAMLVYETSGAAMQGVTS